MKKWLLFALTNGTCAGLPFPGLEAFGNINFHRILQGGIKERNYTLTCT
jgi:hypothetical protein